MPLPKPNLDDKRFEGLVAEATRLIPRQTPDWTDHNRHDPGITLIELFAWLTEMQQYYLNQVPDANYWKFLKLLGIVSREATSARAEVTFELNGTATLYVPQGARLAAGDVPFETEEPLTVLSVQLKKVLSASQAGLKDNTAVHDQPEGLSFAAFGDAAEKDSRLYLGFDQAFPAGAPIRLTFDLFEDYKQPRGAHGGEPIEVTPSALVVWEYYTADGSWAPLDFIATIQLLIADALREVSSQAPSPLCLTLRQRLHKQIGETCTFRQLPQDAQEYVEKRIADAQTVNELSGILTDPTLLRLKKDQTLMFSQSGRVLFTAPDNMQKRKIDPFPDELYWLRATVRQEGYELPPRIDTIRLNSVTAVQRETLSEVLTFSGTGQANQSITATGYLALKGTILVQVRDTDGLWQDWEQAGFTRAGPDSSSYTLIRSKSGTEITARFGDGKRGKIPPRGHHNIRLIAYLPGFEQRRLLGSSNGLPGQTFRLDSTRLDPPRVFDDVLVQVEERFRGEKRTELRWRDWRRVDDFYASGMDDPHYVLDTETGSICFGDGVNGAIPEVPSDPDRKNIRVIRCRVGGGTGGNVRKGTIWEIIDPVASVTPFSIVLVVTDTVSIKKIGEPAGVRPKPTVTNRRAASGGAEKETLAQVAARARRALTTPDRAITSGDYERLALSTPGLRVARASAVPLFKPGLSNYPDSPEPAAVTVVVVPFSLADRPIPSQGFLQTVRRHLDRHRLVTARVYVIGPDYVRVGVQASVLLRGGFSSTDIHQQIRTALNTFLHPLNGGPEGNGWPFGRMVYTSEVYQVIENVEGVDGVQRLELIATGDGFIRDDQGNIKIPPQSLVYAGDHRIEITNPDAVCR